MEQQCNAIGNTDYKKYIFPLCPINGGNLCQYKTQPTAPGEALTQKEVQKFVKTLLSLFQEGFGPDHNIWSLLLTIIVISTYCSSEFFSVPLVWLHLPKKFKMEWLIHLLTAVSNEPFLARNFFSFDEIKKLIKRNWYTPVVFFVDPNTYDKKIQKCYLENPSERTQHLYDKYNMKAYLYSYRFVLAEYPPNSYTSRHSLCCDLPMVTHYPSCDSECIKAIRKDCGKLLKTLQQPLSKAISELLEKAPAYSPAFSIYALSIVLNEIGAIDESELKSVCELLEKLEIRSKKNFGLNQDKDVLWLVSDYMDIQAQEGSVTSEIVDGYYILDRISKFMDITTDHQVLVKSNRIREILNQYVLVVDDKIVDIDLLPDKGKGEHPKKRIQRTGIKIDKEALQEAISRG